MPKLKITAILSDGKDVKYVPSLIVGDVLTLEEVEEAKEWFPAEGEGFFYISSIDGMVHECVALSPKGGWFKMNNYFQTRKEAETARDAIKELLKGMKK